MSGVVYSPLSVCLKGDAFFPSLGDSPNPPKEDTPTSSLDSLSSTSPTTAAVHGPPGTDRNHLVADGDWASTA